MRRMFDPLAVLVILAGFLLFNTSGSAVFGALLVAGGAYALVLPQVVTPQSQPTH